MEEVNEKIRNLIIDVTEHHKIVMHLLLDDLKKICDKENFNENMENLRKQYLTQIYLGQPSITKPSISELNNIPQPIIKSMVTKPSIPELIIEKPKYSENIEKINSENKFLSKHESVPEPEPESEQQPVTEQPVTEQSVTEQSEQKPQEQISQQNNLDLSKVYSSKEILLISQNILQKSFFNKVLSLLSIIGVFLSIKSFNFSVKWRLRIRTYRKPKDKIVNKSWSVGEGNTRTYKIFI
jgi:hypothetical protein